jgi:hypothetical protein
MHGMRSKAIIGLFNQMAGCHSTNGQKAKEIKKTSSR